MNLNELRAQGFEPENMTPDQFLQLHIRRESLRRLPSYSHEFDDVAISSAPIEEHGIIGNMLTAALICSDGSINWYCYPDFDSPSIFGFLLDEAKGGFYKISVGINRDMGSCKRKQMYHPDTNLLISRYLSPTGVGQVIDYFPLRSFEREKLVHRTTLIRELEVVRGKVYFRIECCPSFDYGRAPHEVLFTKRGVQFNTETTSFEITSLTPLAWKHHPTFQGGVEAFVTLVPGEREVLFFRECSRHNVETSGETLELVDQLRQETICFWREWISGCSYRGRWREHVYRSALIMKLLIFEPSGAVVASATTSLPSGPDHSTRDFRLSLIRDSAYAMYVLVKLGFFEEASEFLKWIEQKCEVSQDGKLFLAYKIGANASMQEIHLDSLQGYQGVGPVYGGSDDVNLASLSVNGYILDTAYIRDEYGEPISFSLWKSLRRIVEQTCAEWRDPDFGHWTWSTGCPKDHYTFTKTQAWLTVDRGLRIALKRSLPARVHEWRAVRDEIKEDIMNNGYDKDMQTFVERYGSQNLDASVLRFVQLRFLSPTDPRIVNTVERILRSPANGGLSHSYLVHRHSYSDTEMLKMEGTSPVCTFFAVATLAELGKHDKKYLDRSRELFELALGLSANHLGILPEEISFNGRFVGNFPRTFSHLSQIMAILSLNEALNETESCGPFGKSDVQRPS